MKKLIIAISLAMAAGSASYMANASFFDFGDDDKCEWKMGPQGPWCEPSDNDWPEWTPMYFMEEMMDEFDDDDDNYGPYGYYDDDDNDWPEWTPMYWMEEMMDEWDDDDDDYYRRPYYGPRPYYDNAPAQGYAPQGYAPDYAAAPQEQPAAGSDGCK